jgi:hypothetical protein
MRKDVLLLKNGKIRGVLEIGDARGCILPLRHLFFERAASSRTQF